MIRRFIIALERIADALEVLVTDDKKIVRDKQKSVPDLPGEVGKDDDNK